MNLIKLGMVGAIASLGALPMTANAATQAEPAAASVTLHGGTLQKAEWVWVGHRRYWHNRHYWRHGGYGYGWHRHWRHHHRW